MKANNLSISIPNKGCEKNCPYCVSKMTGYVKADPELFRNNMGKVFHMAKMSEVSSVSITGKGEPMLNINMVREVVNRFKQFPIEIQTCGLELADDTGLVDLLVLEGVDIFALSMDRWSDFEDMKYVIERINHMNKTVRVTMNVSDMLDHPSSVGFMEYIKQCNLYDVQQFSFRSLTIPNGSCGTAMGNRAANWIREHVYSDNYYGALIAEFEKEQHDNGTYMLLRQLNYGAYLYDVEGIAFTFFDYCIQDHDRTSNSTGIRSLIYQEDGHMYTTWNRPASRIF